MRMGPGCLVRLKGNKFLMARVVRNIHDIPGGRVLDQKIAGFYDWNIAELEVVPRTSPLRRYFID